MPTLDTDLILRHLDKQVENIHQRIDDRCADVQEDVRDLTATVRAQNGRIGSLEQFRMWIYGGLGLGGVVLAWLFQ